MGLGEVKASSDGGKRPYVAANKGSDGNCPTAAGFSGLVETFCYLLSPRAMLQDPVGAVFQGLPKTTCNGGREKMETCL